MRVALIAPPFILPPIAYGRTELFIADLARALQALGVGVTVYANGESTVEVNRRWLFANSQWPVKDDGYAQLKDMEHTILAIHDASDDCDIVHVSTALGLTCSRLSRLPMERTIRTRHG